jgi:hypothetical protein
MVRTFLKVHMELGSSFLFLQEQIKDIIIITHGHPNGFCGNAFSIVLQMQLGKRAR